MWVKVSSYVVTTYYFTLATYVRTAAIYLRSRRQVSSSNNVTVNNDVVQDQDQQQQFVVVVVVTATTTATTGTKRKEREYEADEGGESTNINVVVRCRGRNEREVKENSTVVVRTDGAKGNIVELSMGPNALSNKTYNFDRVFSPAADQSMVFDEVVKPILDEVSRDMRWCIPSFLCINHDPRSFPGTTAPSLPMGRLAQGRHTPCPVT